MNIQIDSKHIELIQERLNILGEISRDNLKFFLKQMIPAFSENEMERFIQELVSQEVIVEQIEGTFILGQNGKDSHSKNVLLNNLHEKTPKNDSISNPENKFNLKKGMFRFNLFFSLIIIPIIALCYYFTHRIIPTQDLILKNGGKIKVYPFVANNAQIYNEFEHELNSYNSKSYPMGYNFNLDSSDKWNVLVNYLSKNKFSYGYLELEPLQYNIDIGTNEYLGIGCTDNDWVFDANTGILQIIGEEGFYNDLTINLTKENYQKQNTSEDWPLIQVFCDQFNILYGIYGEGDENYLKLINIELEDSILENNLYGDYFPIFYNHRFQDYGINSILYNDYILYRLSEEQLYFVEPPFIKLIQSIFSTKKRYLTSTDFVLIIPILSILYWFIVFIVNWLKKGFYPTV